MKQLAKVILGGDTFSDHFRALYDHHTYWNLTDPDYCISVMRSAYDGGCRAFDFSFGNVRAMFERFQDTVDEEIVGYANPTWVQGCKLDGKDLQFMRNRILRTFTERPGFWPAERAELVREDLRVNTCMVFGHDLDAQPLSDKEIASIYLDEEAYCARLDELKSSQFVFIGGTDADWLFTAGREDLVVRMAEIVRSRGQQPLLLCHYGSTVLPKADAMNLDVDGYLTPINRSWAWFSQEEARQAVLNAKKPVTAFMAFACGGLTSSMEESARYLHDECGVNGILYGTTKIPNAKKTAQMLKEIFDT